ncbi:hypothetical protein ACNOYE_32930 [Nannocystaceae bacterium ST9]
MRTPLRPLFFVGALLVGLVACAELRQNLRGQELSYRGAWFCEGASCKDGELVASRRGTREGTTDIATVKLDSKLALAFTAASAFETLEATVRDCKGNSAAVPSSAIVPAGKHKVGDSTAKESWIVWIDRDALAKLELGSGKCARWLIDAKAGWTDGASYSMTVGIEVEK